jgi:tetratricopeptide (TPR) repeat protein
MTFKRILFLLPVLLTACAHQAQPGAAPAAKQSTAPEVPQDGVKAEQPLNLPNLELNAQMVYEFLLGEVSMQRGRPELAAQVYLDLAKTTRDPRVARRAAQLAFEARVFDKAVEAFALWQELEPQSPLARQMLYTLLLSGGKLAEARPHVEAALAAEPEKVDRVFMQVYSLLARYPDMPAAADFVGGLAAGYPKVAEAHWAWAHLLESAGRHANALDEARKVRELKPDWESGAIQETQFLMKDNPQQALAGMRKYVASHPDAREARLFYARALLEQKQYAEARSEFRYLAKAHPENPEMVFAVALLSLQMGEFEQAENELKETLKRGKQDGNTVYFYLAQLSEAKKDDAAALNYYRQVHEGEYAGPARLRVVQLLGKAGKLEEARAEVQKLPAHTPQQKVQAILLEAQLLREAKQYEAVYRLLSQSVEKVPGQAELLYEAGMAADKLGKYDQLEHYMRKLIQLKPDYAHAYNALGYSLLDRNVRIAEAVKLVEKAYQLDPNDTAILDSVGWGYFRQGNLEKSVEFLQRAYALNPDPEIAAHLGEVLWLRGDKAGAGKVWRDGLQASPDNPALQAVMKKYQP